MEKWMHKWQVIERLGITEPELMNIVSQGRLAGFDQNYVRVKHYGRYHVDQKEDERLPGAVLSTRVAYFDTGDIIAYERNISTIVEKGAPDANNAALIKHLSEAGKKGGTQSKVKKPILTAIVKYIKETPKANNWSNAQIAKSFCKKHIENKPFCVSIDEAKWEIYFSGDVIFSRLVEFGSKNSDNNLKSIRYTTFLNSYIPKAKKTI